MASLLERLKYIIEDIFGKKTYAESQRDKYKKVVRNLEKELKKTDNLSDVMAQLATDYNTMEMNPDSAQGKLSDTFVTKESENCEAVEKLGADFKEIIAEVKLKLEFARKAEIFMAFRPNIGYTDIVLGTRAGFLYDLSLIHISEPTRH